MYHWYFEFYTSNPIGDHSSTKHCSVNCIVEIYYMNPENSYMLPMDANVTTVSELGTTVKNPVLCYYIQNVEIYVLEIDIFLIPNQ